MKHKYSVVNDAAADQLIIKEYAELDKEMFSLLCEERYDLDTVRNAMDSGTDALIQAFRTRNFYPTYAFAERIAGAILALYDEQADTKEIVIDDAEFLARKQREEVVAATTDEKSEDLDGLLDDEEETMDEDFEDISIDKINSGIKIADDESPDLDDDN